MPPLAPTQWAPATLLIFAVACMAAPGAAPAQGLQGGTITEEFEAKAAERARRQPAPPGLPAFAPSERGADKRPLFMLAAVDIAGATVIAHEEIARVYGPYLRRQVSQADLLKITDGITELYRHKGYALSRAFIPPQDVKDGRVQVKVVEGYIGDILIEGDDSQRFGAGEFLRPITAERPLRLATFERHLLLLSDTPGVRIKDTILKEVGEATGRFRLTVQIETWRTFANIDLDNRGTSEIGPLQSFITTAVNSAAAKGDTWALNVLTIPNSPEELIYVGGIVEMPIGTQGVRLGARGSYSDVRQDGIKALLDTRTQTDEAGIYASMKPLRTREMSLGFVLSAGLRNAEEHNIFGPVYDDRIRAVSLAADLQVHDKYEGSTYLVVALRHGDGEPGSPGVSLSRPDAEGSFEKAYWSVTRQQRLGGPWSAVVSSMGQLASSPLLLSEQFYIGGPLLGRAYASGSLSGDSGLTGLVELRFDQNLEIGLLTGYQLYAFADAGVVWTRGIPGSESLSSLGVGVRLALQDGYRMGFEVAVPVEYHSLTGQDEGTRFYFSLSKSFKGCAQLWCVR